MTNPQAGSALATLKGKMQTLRDELEKCRDDLEIKCKELESEKAHRSQNENEIMMLTRKLQHLEESHEQAVSKAETANIKNAELNKIIDEHERSKRVLENRQNIDDSRMETLEHDLKTFKLAASNAEQKHEETARKLRMLETELERAEDRAETAEKKVKQLDGELIMISNTLKSLEHNGSKASQREDTYEVTVKDLSARLKDAEFRASDNERSFIKVQRDYDALENELNQTKLQNKSLKEELETAFNEIASI